MDAASRQGIDALFRPRSIAVVGASRDPRSRSHRLVRQLTAAAAGTEVYPVTPNATEIAGVPTIPAIGAAPGPIDAAVIHVAWQRVAESLVECREAGVRAAVVVAAVPSDIDDFNQQIRTAIAGSSLRVVGPNCLGVGRLAGGASLSHALDGLTLPRPRPGKGVALVGHSGGLLLAAAARLAELGVGVSHFVSCGNEADLQFVDFVDYFADDPEVRVVLAYIEEARDAQRLLRVARSLKDRGKGLVLLQVGRSAEAQVIAAGHTGALVGDLALAKAHLREHGAEVVTNISEAVAAASVLRTAPATAPGVGVIGPTGGISASFADLCHDHDIPLPQLSRPAQLRFAELIAPSNVHSPDVINPVDLGAPGAGDDRVWLEGLRVLLEEPEVGAVAAVVSADWSAVRLPQSIALAERSGKPLVLYMYVADVTGPRDREAIMRLGSDVPVFTSDVEAVSALGVLLRRYGLSGADGERPVTAFAVPRPPLVVHDEIAVKAWLSGHGVAVPKGAPLSAAEVSTAPLPVPFPLVLKLADARVVHKSDIGAVRVGLTSRDEVVAAASDIAASALATGVAEPRFLVEEQVRGGPVEWLVAIRNDFRFGPVVTLGVGGLLAEAHADVAVAPAPLSSARAAELVSSLRAWRVIEARGLGGARALAALAELVVRLSQLAWSHRDLLAEIELNPVVVTPDGLAVALDAMAVGAPGALSAGPIQGREAR